MLTLTLLLSSMNAEAANCANGDAPVGYTTSSSVYCRSICTYTDNALAPDSILCLLDDGSTGGGTIYSATYYGTSTKEFSFWGTSSTGSKFCCAYDENGQVDEIDFEGTDQADHMFFSSSLPPALGGQSLEDPGGTTPLDLYMNSFAGDDTLRGSYDTDADIFQYFDGGNDTDTVYCLTAACYARGGHGSDTVIGSGFADQLFGDSVVTDVTDGNDFISGHGGDDDIWGNGADDTICGDDGDDLMYGGFGNDTIWGSGAGDGTDDAYGDADTDTCSAENSVCDNNTLASRPAACP